MQPEPTTYYLGPLGALMPLVTPEPELKAKRELKVNVSESVSFARSGIVQGFRYRWEFEESYLMADDYAFLDALYTGVVRGPLRIIDPLLKNRLRLPAAAARTTWAWAGGAASWKLSAGAGVVSESSTIAPPAVEYTSVERQAVWYRPSTVMVWNAAGAGDRWLYPNGAPNADFTYPARLTDPVLPGETVTLSYWAKAAAGSGTLNLATVNAAGTPSPAGSVAIGSTTWQRHEITVTAPAGAVGVYPYFGADTADTVLHIGHGQLETGPDATSWVPGYGAPQTQLYDLDPVSPQYPYMSAALTILEL